MAGEHNHSYGSNKSEMLGRLKRIEGQVRGIQKMIEEDRYCVDILTQLAAVKSATHQVALNLLDSHMHHCVRAALTSGNEAEEKIDELMDVVRKVTKG
ncbi:metal-sensitive transcriptional regulator [Alicyclobacillus fastidiosus]|uniref:Metal-sensitive transcriptional regulator n=1 Tax=Alicyclobacillus fastidiosus TaxID=392011 RepID=A0ABY6ZKQ2_9BACL|nr:metal-sensitive transcriptional regulator [Alicyclobacillus fastidiosus]WAH43452.1 metal-sensitive transcriptional regulator [Alicyclobacillus fastidiosus]GMA59605.1 copper-sensing transcriptional repressor CsoR [Alicyclobacillus fastidiosus]